MLACRYFPDHAVTACLDKGPVLVRKVQYPTAIAADHAFEYTALKFSLRCSVPPNFE